MKKKLKIDYSSLRYWFSHKEKVNISNLGFEYWVVLQDSFINLASCTVGHNCFMSSWEPGLGHLHGLPHGLGFMASATHLSKVWSGKPI